MSIKRKACIASIYEHPARKASDKSVAQLHADCACGALEDAGLSKQGVDGYFVAGDAPGLGALNMCDYMGLRVRHLDTTETDGSSYLIHVAHAAQAIAMGKCNVALITFAGRPRTEGSSGMQARNWGNSLPDAPYELPFGLLTVNQYVIAAMRHMYEYGTTAEQLAWIKVAASHHAQHNPNAMLRENVIHSVMISDPLHRLDCCVVSDGGGALIVTRPEIAKSLNQPLVHVLGADESPRGLSGGEIDFTTTGAAWSGPAAFEKAGVQPADIQHALIYDSFTITVLLQLEGLGFCKKGQGGRFVVDGNLIAGQGRLPINTDGGGLCNNHPANRGGAIKVIEAVRQLRTQAHPAVQVKNCGLALAQGTGGDGRPPWQRHFDSGARMNAMITPYQERLLPAPRPNPGDDHFFEATTQGRLLIKRCEACCEFHWYPRAICPFCLSNQVDWHQALGLGTIYSYSITRRVDPSSYEIAYVTLDEGVSMMTNIVDRDLDAICIDQRVRLVFKYTHDSGSPVPCFTPTGLRHGVSTNEEESA